MSHGKNLQQNYAILDNSDEEYSIVPEDGCGSDDDRSSTAQAAQGSEAEQEPTKWSCENEVGGDSWVPFCVENISQRPPVPQEKDMNSSVEKWVESENLFARLKQLEKTQAEQTFALARLARRDEVFSLRQTVEALSVEVQRTKNLSMTLNGNLQSLAEHQNDLRNYIGQVDKRSYERYYNLERVCEERKSDAYTELNNNLMVLSDHFRKKSQHWDATITRLRNSPRASRMERDYELRLKQLAGRISRYDEDADKLKSLQAENASLKNSFTEGIEKVRNKANELQSLLDTNLYGVSQEVADKEARLQNVENQIDILVKSSDRTTSWKTGVNNDLQIWKDKIQVLVQQIIEDQNRSQKRVDTVLQDLKQDVNEKLRELWKMSTNTSEYCESLFDAREAEWTQKLEQRIEKLKEQVHKETSKAIDSCQQILEVCKESMQQSDDLVKLLARVMNK